MRSETHYTYIHRVSYHETDAMGVVHHSNYLRIFEDARVEWINERNLKEIHYPHSEMTLAVLETSTRHLRPAFFNDKLSVQLQVRREKLKIRFRYAIYSERFEAPIGIGDVLLVPLNRENKPTRLPQALIDAVEKEKWIETWPSNL